METPASRAAATGGRLPTEGPSVLPVLVQTGDGSAGDAFAAEVARASERAHGGGRQQKRLDELEGVRRDARRAGFGREQEAEGEDHAVEAVFRGEHAPVRAEPASAAQPAAEERLPAAVEGRPAVRSSSPSAEARPVAPVDPALQAGTMCLPSQTAASTAVSPSTPQLPQLANAQAPASELQPLEPASLARPGGQPRKTASAPPPAGPDAAVLERAAEILRQIQLHATPHVRRLTLELEPAELGRLSVQLALRTGRVTAIVRGENPETLALLEQHEAELSSVLARRGIAADTVRFELGFGGQRSRNGARAPAPFLSTPSSSASSSPSLPPRDNASRIDLLA